MPAADQGLVFETKGFGSGRELKTLKSVQIYEFAWKK